MIKFNKVVNILVKIVFTFPFFKNNVLSPSLTLLN